MQVFFPCKKDHPIAVLLGWVGRFLMVFQQFRLSSYGSAIKLSVIRLLKQSFFFQFKEMKNVCNTKYLINSYFQCSSILMRCDLIFFFSFRVFVNLTPLLIKIKGTIYQRLFIERNCTKK